MIFFQADTQAPVRKTVPARHEISEADKWDLKLLYPTDATWQEDFQWFKNTFPKYAEFKGTLGKSPEALLACLEFDKSLDVKVERLYHYASLQTSEDSSNNDYLTREGMLQNLMTQSSEIASFITPEIQAIDEETFKQFLKADCLKPWLTRLRKIRRFRHHTLSENEERLMALSGSALSGHHETFSQLTNVDMKFGFITNEKGEEVELSNSAFSSFLQKRDPELRKKAFHQYYEAIDGNKYTLSSSLTHSIKADVFNARARRYPSALHAALFPDAVPSDVYENLISTVHKYLPALYRYFELRRKVLQLTEIHHYDTYVPIVSSIDRKTTFDEAIELVMKSLKPLGVEYTKVLGDGMRKQRWCDRYESKGKRSGAFSSSSYGNPPYILMNFKEDVFSDVYTLAHEAGHSMHSWYSQSNQSFQDYNYPIFLAEVASTFNEELLTHHLLETTQDKAMRAYIISRQIDDIRGTIFRQTMFAEFEKLAHELEEKGEALTLDTFRSVYRGLLNLYFGPNFQIDDDLELECLRIPHFYSAFYVYKYATGLSAAIALSRRVLEGGIPELNNYLGFLKSGGSRYPLETLVSAGVDMSTPAPVESALQLFSKRLDELEKLMD